MDTWPELSGSQRLNIDIILECCCARKGGNEGRVGEGGWVRGRESRANRLCSLAVLCAVCYLLEEVVAHRNQQLLLAPREPIRRRLPLQQLILQRHPLRHDTRLHRTREERDEFGHIHDRDAVAAACVCEKCGGAVGGEIIHHARGERFEGIRIDAVLAESIRVLEDVRLAHNLRQARGRCCMHVFKPRGDQPKYRVV